jgi:hypothetical protein
VLRLVVLVVLVVLVAVHAANGVGDVVVGVGDGDVGGMASLAAVELPRSM